MVWEGPDLPRVNIPPKLKLLKLREQSEVDQKLTLKYCLNNEQERMSRAFKPDSTRMQFVLKGFKISDMDQLILAH